MTDSVSSEIRITDSASYLGSMEQLRSTIAEHRSADRIKIRVVIQHGYFHLLMKPSDLYVIGFENAKGEAFLFSDFAEEDDAKLPINSGHGYGGLDIWQERFKWGGISSMTYLIHYQEGHWHDRVRKALGLAVVVVAEAARFEELPIAFAKVLAGEQRFVDPSQDRWKDLINNWEKYSHDPDPDIQSFVRIKHLR